MNSLVMFFLIVVFSFKSTQTLKNVCDKRYRIYGGYKANLGDISYIVSVERYNTHICGGTILSPLVVLSAAHCFYNGLFHKVPDIKGFSVRAGIITTKSGGQLRAFSKILIHPRYEILYSDYDAAIVVLQSKLSFDRNVKSIEFVDNKYKIPRNRAGLVCGWGVLQDRGKKYPQHLQTAVVRFITNEKCEKIYNNLERQITTQMFCAEKAPKNACQGDSGGPFVIDFTVIGITSFGMDCVDQDLPVVYTNVARISDWIREMMSTHNE